MNKESLKNLPLLVQAMDENLAINITEFVNNPLLKHLKINQNKLIETIKQSNKFHYDNKTGIIKFKEKADRNILIVANYVREEDEKETKIDTIKNILKESGKNFVNRIKNIDKVGDALHIVFEHEDISMDAEKYLLKLTSETVKIY